MRFLRRGKKALGGILLFGILVAGIGSALSGWNFLSRGTVKAFTADSKRAEACISRDGQAILYTSIAAAVTDARANEAIYVIPRVNSNNPDSNPIVIDEDITIDNGKKLIIPYSLSISGGTISATYQNPLDDKGRHTGASISRDNSAEWFADQSLAQVKTHKKTEVLIAPNASLNVKSGSELIVGGSLGAVSLSSYAMGQTVGDYAQISMDGGSLLSIEGALVVNGYIKPWDERNDDASVLIGSNSASGATVTLPFVAYDFIGGSAALAGNGGDTNPFKWNGALWSEIFPVETYDMPNVSVPMTVYSGSTVEGQYDFYFNQSHTIGQFTMIGDEANPGLLTLGTNSSVTIDYDSAAYYEDNDGNFHGLTLADNRYLATNDDPPAVSWIDATHAARTTVSLSGTASVKDIEISITLNLGDSELVVPISTQGGDITDAIKAWLGGLIGGIAGGLLNLTYGRLSIPFSYKWGIVLESGSTLNVPGSYVNFLPGSSLVISEGSSLRVSSGGHIAGYQNIDSSSKLTSVYPLELADGTALSDARIVNNGSISVESAASFGGYIKTETEKSSIFFSSDAGRSVSTNELNWKTSSWEFTPKTQKAKIDISFGSALSPQKRFDIDGFPQDTFTSAIDPEAGPLYEANDVQIITVTVNPGSVDGPWADSMNYLGAIGDAPNTFNVIANADISFVNARENGIAYIYFDGAYCLPDSDGTITIRPSSNDTQINLTAYSPLPESKFEVKLDSAKWEKPYFGSLDNLVFNILLDGVDYFDQIESVVQPGEGWLGRDYISFDETFNKAEPEFSNMPTLYVGTLVSFDLKSAAKSVSAGSGAARIDDASYIFVITGNSPVFVLSKDD